MCENLISAQLLNDRLLLDSIGFDHSIHEYNFMLSSRNHPQPFICGIVLRNITQRNPGLRKPLMGSSNKEKVLPAQADHHHMTISAGQDKTFSWYHF